MSLKHTIKKLLKEDSISIPKSYISLINPNNPDDERGMIMFSMDIISKEEAKGDPVGEAQKEPNKNPFLKTPTAGRGLGDALAAIGVSVPSISFNPFGKFLPFIIFAMVMSTVLTFAIVLK